MFGVLQQLLAAGDELLQHHQLERGRKQRQLRHVQRNNRLEGLNVSRKGVVGIAIADGVQQALRDGQNPRHHHFVRCAHVWDPAQRAGSLPHLVLGNTHQSYIVVHPLQIGGELLVGSERKIQFGEQSLEAAVERGQPLGKVARVFEAGQPDESVGPVARLLRDDGVALTRIDRSSVGAVGSFNQHVSVIGKCHSALQRAVVQPRRESLCIRARLQPCRKLVRKSGF